MKHPHLRRQLRAASSVSLSLAAALALAAAPAAAPPQQRLALIIGNGGYAGAWQPLPTCPVAARAVAADLRSLGFETIEHVDVTNGQMSAGINKLAQQLAPDAVAVAYFCGYAVAFEGRGFLVPIGANIDQPNRVLTEGIIATSLSGILGRASANPGLVVLDVTEPGSEGPRPAFGLPQPPANVAQAVSTAVVPTVPGAMTVGMVAELRRSRVELGSVLAAMRAVDEREPARHVTVVGDLRVPVVLRGAPTSAAGTGVPSEPSGVAPEPVGAAREDPVAKLTARERRQIQSRLQALGFYNGAIDGGFGANTQGAIRRFQAASGTSETGELTELQAASLLSRERAPPP